MTGKQTFNLLDDTTITDPFEVLILMAISDEAGKDGRSRPRIQDIALKARCDERTTQRKIKMLEKKGKLKIIVRKGTSNEYQLLGGDTQSPRQSVAPSQSRVLMDAESPHSISALSIKDVNSELSNESFKESKDSAISNEIAIPVKVVKTFDPDEPKKKRDPSLFIFASEIAILCSLSLGNGSKGECFTAAQKLLSGISPPKNPKELLPYFGKGGLIYQEWPWSKDGRLKPMDIPKHWPRLSGAIKPPSATSSADERRRYVEGEYAEFIEH